MRTSSATIRKSAANASSQPAPSAYPFTAAMTGWPSRAIAFIAWFSVRPNAAISLGPQVAISLMSAPAANDRSPP